jgi:hypothetical protein
MIPEDVFNKLKKIAFIETDAWEGLVTSLREEMQALRLRDLPAITKSTIHKEMAINGVRVVADSRKKLLSEIHTHLRLKLPVSMANVYGLADERQRQEMSGWQARFAAYGEDVHTLNTKNMETIKATLDVVSDSIRFLTNITQSTPRYTAGGNISAHPLQGRLISKRG